MPAASLHIWLGDRRVGAIRALDGDRSIFAFDDAYADDPSRPTLGLYFKTPSGGLRREFNPVQTRLAPFFSNLLPEGRLRDYLAKRAGVKTVREYALLEILGHDLPGALSIRASNEALEEDPQPPLSTRGPRQGPLRFSLAGVQLKFSAIGQASGGLTIPVSGEGGDWIVKLPSLVFPGVAANEFSMMRLAAANGLEVPDARLVPLDQLEGLPEGLGRFEEEAYAVRRFDRTPQGRVHIEDFAQVFDAYPEAKYERASYRSLAQVLWIETGDAGTEEFIRRLVFNTLIGNADMHLKNWSLIYRDGRTPQLSPAYDFVATTSYIADPKLALRVGRTKLMAKIDLDEIGYMAARAGIPEHWARTIAKNAAARFRDVWADEAANLPIAKAVRGEIERLLSEVPLANGR